MASVWIHGSNYEQHQELMRMLLGILPPQAKVKLDIRWEVATDAAYWIILANTLAQLNII